MGDSGSLPLGGLLAWMALVSKQELVLPLIAIVFVARPLDRARLQTFWYRRSGGKRLFTSPRSTTASSATAASSSAASRAGTRCTVVVRFWILAAMGAMASLALLKVR